MKRNVCYKAGDESIKMNKGSGHTVDSQCVD